MPPRGSGRSARTARRDRQLERRAPGARRVGWTLGGDIPDVEAVAGRRPAIGHLTGATLLPDGGVYEGGGGALHADTEVVVEVRAEARVTRDHAAVARTVAELLAAVGERVRDGDRFLTGAVTQVAVAPGDAVTAELDGLGRVALTISAQP